MSDYIDLMAKQLRLDGAMTRAEALASLRAKALFASAMREDAAMREPAQARHDHEDAEGYRTLGGMNPLGDLLPDVRHEREAVEEKKRRETP